MKKYLVSFYGAGKKGNNSFWTPRQQNLNNTALANGIDEVIPWNMDKLKETIFYDQNKSILVNKKGAGYWAWKPYIIFNQLSKINEGDIVIYYDVGSKTDGGFEIKTDIGPMIDWAIDHNGGIYPGFYRPDALQNHFTKKDCFVYMGCDSEKYWNHPQIGATYSIWQKNELSMNIITEWMSYSKDRRIITDEPNVCGLQNSDGFKSHRHDQSISTNLAIKYGLKVYPKTLGSGKNLTSQLKLMELDLFCYDNFNHGFDNLLPNHLQSLEIDNFEEKIGKVIKMIKFLSSFDRLHSYWEGCPFILHTFFDENGNYDKYEKYLIPTIRKKIESIKTL